MDERLKEYFPDLFREVRTVALLRLMDGVSSAKAVRPAFLSSYLSNQSPDIATGETSVRNLAGTAGRRQDHAEAFMKSTVSPGFKLLFDGTPVFTDSKDSLAAKGYNPDHSTETQARLPSHRARHGEAGVLQGAVRHLTLTRMRAFRGGTYPCRVSMLYYYGLINALRACESIHGITTGDE